METIPPVFSDQ